MDATRRLGRLGTAAGDAAIDRPRVRTALALEAVGIAQRALDWGVEHAKDRQQFGKSIGVYQAVSHSLVDAMMATELARSVAYWAAWCVAEGDDQAATAAAAAKASPPRRPSPRASARSRCTAGSASPGSTRCTGSTSARNGSRPSMGSRRAARRDRGRDPCLRPS
jgi:hypothetical protein